jgi:hypothetical protein
MYIALSRTYLELIMWRDEEIKNGNMSKAKQIHQVIKKKRVLKAK